MVWRIIETFESVQTQLSVEDTVEVVRRVCVRFWNRFRDAGNVICRPGQSRSRAITKNDDYYIP